MTRNNALAETTIGLYKTECVREGSPFRTGPLRTLADLEEITSTWVHWYDWEKHVRFDERYLRPADVDSIIGDASKAKSVLGWKPQVVMPELVKIMVGADIQALKDRTPTWIDRPALQGWRPAPG